MPGLLAGTAGSNPLTMTGNQDIGPRLIALNYPDRMVNARQCFGESVRGRWGIESMHRVLDVNFRGDGGTRAGDALGNGAQAATLFAMTPY